MALQFVFGPVQSPASHPKENQSKNTYCGVIEALGLDDSVKSWRTTSQLLKGFSFSRSLRRVIFPDAFLREIFGASDLGKSWANEDKATCDAW